ncbi:hypothetical protein [Vreelandella boliviensis]|uniref:hypothetical protein n=1 Tax=Vreelandella boliviensis TaxID=223527 RepID=UPI001B8CB79B|nr:hypothetical protein [Halomonas boliviensis]MBS3670214.1 hypothetical protein [Halomonas boliviensis]
MGTEEQILQYQLDHGIFDNAKFSGTEGIAKRAITNGISTLSPKQQAVLNPYLSQYCSGVTNPGGHHNDCFTVLEGEALLDAYRRCDDSECLVCESCENEAGFYANQWEKISRE